MNEEVVQKIALDKIVPDPRNRRHGANSMEELEGLAASIKTHGVQEPAIVREVDEAEAGAPYMLVAGERRWRASELAGMDYLPCIVREMTVAQALAIQLIENLHRQDIHPLDEAEGYERLRDEAGYTAELIAQEVGRSPAYVYQRLRLQKLLPEIRAMLEGAKISTAVALIVARLPEAQQKLVQRSQLNEYQLKYATAFEVERWIKEHLLCDLKKIAWRLADASLVKKAGACSECPKRTGVDPGLFEDGGAQKCLDPACYKAKQKAIVAKNLASLEGEEHLVVSEDWYNTGKDVLTKQDWQEVKKSEPGALRAVVVGGNKPGRLTWAKKIDRAQRAATLRGKPQDESPEAEAARAKRLEAKQEVNRKLFEAVINAAGKSEPIGLLRGLAKEQAEYGDLDALATWYGLKPKEGVGDEENALTIAMLEKVDTMDTHEVVLFLLSLEISGALNVGRYSSEISSRLDPYLEEYKIDGEAVRAAVYSEKGVPLKDPDEEEDEEDEGDEDEKPEYDPGNDDGVEAEDKPAGAR
jgi:ParB/RepB/Spo0J family partition protein